jgi:methionyl-tRNA synthetase
MRLYAYIQFYFFIIFTAPHIGHLYTAVLADSVARWLSVEETRVPGETTDLQ